MVNKLRLARVCIKQLYMVIYRTVKHQEQHKENDLQSLVQNILTCML